MLDPADLLSFYLAKTFQIRLLAIAVTVGVSGAALERFEKAYVPEVASLMLLLIPTSLGAINHRYTYAFACALRAAGKTNAKDEIACQVNARRWTEYQRLSEAPWKQKWWGPLGRFCLSWLTYVPPLIIGVRLAFASTTPWLPWASLAFAGAIVIFWSALSVWGYDLNEMAEKVQFDAVRPGKAVP